MHIKNGARLRAAAAEAVNAVVMGGRSLDTALTQSEARIAAADRSLLRMLCFGTLRRHWRLQSWIDALVDRPIRRRDSVINALLAVGLFQLSETRIPDHAAMSLSRRSNLMSGWRRITPLAEHGTSSRIAANGCPSHHPCGFDASAV